MSVVSAQDKRLAEAAALFVEAIHQAFPAVVTRPIPPYDDEDFTLEVRIPAGMDTAIAQHGIGLGWAWHLAMAHYGGGNA